MKAKVKKFALVAGLVGLIGFMLNTLLMLGQLKGLDSRLSENNKLLATAIECEEAMGVKSRQIDAMATEFDSITAKMKKARDLATGIAATAEDIRQMNDQLLAVNRSIDGIIQENDQIATLIAGRMVDVVGIMGKAGGLLTRIGVSAGGQLSKVARMYSLACANNAGLPALP
ncbi:MAG: hypothetical protein KKF41_10440 [Actinobacteria bacterium]|nr:hypothetical protein [Actinomycetota bacterium]MBU1943061.1 hypothetical protein [Actinomycetota bacterium]MBU2687992.1 hypothetical protein [Actinomycetota bacterium]